MKPRFIKLSYFAWTIAPVGLWLTYASLGLPHAIWSYTWMNDGHGIGYYEYRIYTRCGFIGPYGFIDRPAEDGRCAWVRFFQEEAN